MKNLILLTVLTVLLFGCDTPTYQEKNSTVKIYKEPKTYTQTSTDQFNELVAPAILFSKTKSLGLYGVSVIDGNGNVLTIGNKSHFANGIGEHYNIGDTLKFKVQP